MLEAKEHMVCPDGNEKSFGAFMSNFPNNGIISKGRVLATIGFIVKLPTK
jgi:hypothetical protein